MSGEGAVAAKLKEWGVVRKTPITGRDGKLSSFYCEIKAQYGDPERLRYLADALWNLMTTKPTCVAAGGYGGVPLAVTIALLHNVKLTLIRDLPKSHGKGGVIEGHLPQSSDRVVVVDDKIVTGYSMTTLLGKVRGLQTEIVGVYVIVDVRESLDGFSVASLVSAHDLTH